MPQRYFLYGLHLYYNILQSTDKIAAITSANITTIPLFPTDLLDGSQDSIGYNSSLLAAYSITASITDTDDGGSREVMFDGVATDTQYAEVSFCKIITVTIMSVHCMWFNDNACLANPIPSACRFLKI